MKKTLPGDVYERFKQAWWTARRRRGPGGHQQSFILQAPRTDYAHWFFPMRGGSGATGGMLGALKCDAFIDLDWSPDALTSPSRRCSRRAASTPANGRVLVPERRAARDAHRGSIRRGTGRFLLRLQGCAPAAPSSH